MVKVSPKLSSLLAISLCVPNSPRTFLFRYEPKKRWAILFLLTIILCTASACAAKKEYRQASVKTPQSQLKGFPENQGPDSPDEATSYFIKKRYPPGKAIPMDRYSKAWAHMDKMQRFSTVDRKFLSSKDTVQVAGDIGTWTELGPGNIGGRTRSFLIHPTTPNIMYAGGVAGGVWKSTDGGANWTPISDLIANLAIRSMAMSPSNSDVIYVGTGEDLSGRIGLVGAGIFKTLDGGNHWTWLTSTQNSNFNYVNDLVVSQNNTNRVYAVTQTGIWRSLDGGLSWQKIFNPPSDVSGGCTDLDIRRDQTKDYLFAACGRHSNGTLFRNVDASNSGIWETVLSEFCISRSSIAIAPSDQNIVYLLSASGCGGPDDHFYNGLHAVFRSTSSGDPGTWTAQVRNSDPKPNSLLLTEFLKAIQEECVGGTNIYTQQGIYDQAIAVDPTNPNVVWVGGIEIFRSDDGGINWGLAYDFDLHMDQHAIVFHPEYNGSTNKQMFVANDGGVFKILDALIPTLHGIVCFIDTSFGWISLNHNYGVTQFYHGLPYPDGTTYFGGTQDNGTIRGSDSSGINGWNNLLFADGGFVAMDPTDTNTIYGSTQTGIIHKSTDGGSNFVTVMNGLPPGGAAFINPYVMDPANSQRLWTSRTRMLWITTNAADSWEQASAPINNEDFSALAISPINPDYMLAGTDLGSIYRSTNALSSDASTILSSTRPRHGYLSGLTFDPSNLNVVYATYSSFGGDNVWKSVDAGVSWVPIDGLGPNSLPDVSVHCLMVDPNNSSRLYVGTDVGVFVTNNGGNYWAIENTGFANVITESLSIANGYIFAFTHGRGVFRAPLLSCVFCDDFEDGILAGNWTYGNGDWSESNGELVGTDDRKDIALASPAFEGCGVCGIKTDMTFSGGTASLLGWYSNKKNFVEVALKSTGKLIFKQKVNGDIVAKKSVRIPFVQGQNYQVQVIFNGTDFEVLLNGSSVLTIPAPANPFGTIGFQVKDTTARFKDIEAF